MPNALDKLKGHYDKFHIITFVLFIVHQIMYKIKKYHMTQLGEL